MFTWSLSRARQILDRRRQLSKHKLLKAIYRRRFLGTSFEGLEPRIMLARDLLVADSVTDSILRFDGTSGAPLGAFVSSGSGGLVDPHNPTFGADGNLYVLSTQAGAQKILRYDGVSGGFLGTFVNTGVGGFAGGFGMTFGPNGDLYVATGGANVLRYNGATGAFVGVAATGNGIQRASGVEFGPDGNLYVLDSDSFIDTAYDRVLRFNPDTAAFIDVFVQPGSLDDSISLDFGPEGHLYVPDHKSGNTLSFNGTTGELQRVYAANGSSLDAFPFFLAFGPDGNLYAPAAERIARFDGETIEFIDTFVEGTSGSIVFFPPSGPPTDLAVTDIQIPIGVVQGNKVSITYTVTNNSASATVVGSWDDVVYISTDNIFDPFDQELGRLARTTGLAGGASYTETLSTSLRSLTLGEYHVFVFADRRGVVNDTGRLNNLGHASSTLEVFPPLASSHDPYHSIAVGRTLSAYTTQDITNGELTITYTVYNLTDGYVKGTLLTTTLGTGVTFLSASLLPDRNGQELAWSLGDVAPYGRTSVALMVALGDSNQLRPDAGPQAFGTLDTVAVHDSLPPIVLRTDAIDPALLASTPDANTNDPFIQAKAAQLDYDPNQFFDFLADEVAFESYEGSLRGSRGALWSQAGNALDVANLGVALMRTSGIPARYQQGTLTEEQARQLILSMFPERFQVLGHLPAGTATSDPANDAQLLSEASQHYWFQFDAGSGMQSADPLNVEAQVGQTMASAMASFTEVPDALRHKVQIQLTAETYSQASALFGLSGFSSEVVLDRGFASAELVGKPISVGHLVATKFLGALAFSSRTHTYSPYLDVGDAAFPDQDEVISGTDFQEVFTNFPLGMQLVTGVFLKVTLTGPNGSTKTTEKSLVDRVGFASRQGGNSNVTVDSNGGSAISDSDLFTIQVLPGVLAPSVPIVAAARLDELDAQLDDLITANNNPAAMSTTMRLINIASNQWQLGQFTLRSQFEAANLESILSVEAYFDHPSITIAGTRFNAADEVFESSFDLRRMQMRILPSPGQNPSVVSGFNFAKGLIDNVYEQSVLPVGPGSNLLSTFNILDQALVQNIPLLTLTADNRVELDGLDLPVEVKARITVALGAGMIVQVPGRMVTIGSTEGISWLEIDPDTAEVSGVLPDGTRSELATRPSTELATTQPQVSLLQRIAAKSVEAAEKAKELLERIKNFPQNPSDKFSAFKFLFGYGGGPLPPNLIVFVAAKIALFAVADGLEQGDPPLPDYTSSQFLPYPDKPSNLAAKSVNTGAHATAGSVNANLQAAHFSASGQLVANWQSTTTVGLELQSLSSVGATVRDAQGNIVGSGVVAFSSSIAIPASVSGSGTFNVTGNGNLTSFGASEPTLGVSGQWNNYAADISGSLAITMDTAGLALNGQLLAAGQYTISTASTTIAGAGKTTSPSFSGAVSIIANKASLYIGPASGSLTSAGDSLPVGSGVTLVGYSGTISLSGNATARDTVTLSGSASQVLVVSLSSSQITTDQNNSSILQIDVLTNQAGALDLTASAPPGWSLALSDAGQLTIKPAAGLHSGTHSVLIVAQSQTNPALVASSEVLVTVSATQPGVNVDVVFDHLITVPFGSAQLPTAFQAKVQNRGPSAELFDLSFTGVPSGFEVVRSADALRIPAGQTGIAGVYLRPVVGQPLPAPGSIVSFAVTATSRNNPAVTHSRAVSFTVPQIHSLVLSADPEIVATLPGVSQQFSLTLTSVGNVPELITLTAGSTAGLSVVGVSDQALVAGESKTIVITLTPAAGIPLNSELVVTLSAEFGASDPLLLRIPVEVVAPGVQAVSQAAASAGELGYADLANRLDDLGVALTNLTLQPVSEVFKSQSVAALNAVIGLMRVDEVLVGFVAELTGPRNALAAAETPAEVLAALTDVGDALDGFGAAVTALAKSNFELFLLPNSQLALPQTPAQFELRIHNIGTDTSAYNLALQGVPASVTATLSEQQVTLERDEFATVMVTLTQTSLDAVLEFGFSVDVSVEDAPQIIKSAEGTLTARREFVSVVSVTAVPPFTDAGGKVDVSARVLNAVNRKQQARASFVVRDSSGAQVGTTSTPVDVTLGVQTSLVTIDLGSIATASLANGNYSIVVTLVDENGQPIPGGSGSTSFLVGSPLTASIDVSPSVLPPGTSVVTNTLTIENKTTLIGPLGVLSQTELPGAGGVVKNGHYVYASGTTGIRVFDIANPSNPQLITTFGSSATTLEIRGDKLYALNWAGASLLIYSIADPTAPQLLGTATYNGVQGIPYALTWHMVVTDTHVFVSVWRTTQLVGNPQDIKFQTGDVLAIDVSDPTVPVFVSAMLNTYGTVNDGIGQFLNADNNGGDGNLWEIAQVNANTLLVAGSTAKGDNTQLGSGVVHVVDVSDPAHMVIVRTLSIPGTVQAVGLAIEGNLAFVTASQGGWNDPAPANDADFTGHLVLATLDISDARNPALIHSEVLDRSSVGPYSLHSTPLGNGLFVFSSQGNSLEQSALFVVDANNPTNLITSQTTIPAINAFGNLDGAGNFLYVTSPSGLIIYQIDAPDAVPVTARVQVPNNTGVAIVPDSFNIAPTQIIPGTDFDTLVFNRAFTAGESTATITWQSTVTALTPGEARPVTLGTTIDFTSQGTSGQISLPSTKVVAEQILGIAPATQTVRPGESAAYVVKVTNPSTAAVTYALSIQGIPQEWANFAGQVTVPAGSSVDVPLTLISDPFAPPADYGFIISATRNGVAGTVQSALVLAGAPLLAPAQPEARGVVLELTPSQATSGQGTSASYVVRVTNAGSSQDDYRLLVTGLPVGFQVSFGASDLTVPPGASNFRDVPLTIIAPVGTVAADYPFKVVGASNTVTTISDQVDARLTVLQLGVRVQMSPQTSGPNSVFQMLVTNTGQVPETFDLSLAAPVALVATLGTTSVTLQPGQSQSVPINVGAIDFALPGALMLVGVARSRVNAAVFSSAKVDVTIAEFSGLTTAFDLATKQLVTPGPTNFLLQVNNIGNSEDEFTATIMSTSGPIDASLVGLQGGTTQTIPEFILPGLASGALLLNARLLTSGLATVTVRVSSRTNPNRVVDATATLLTDSTTTLSIAAASADKAEGNSASTPFTFTVFRSGNVSVATNVNFTVAGSGMIPANALDFGGAFPSGQVSFAAGETSKTIIVEVSGDNTNEPDEKFTVSLAQPTGGAIINVGNATGTIRNDDVEAGFRLTCSSLSVGLNTCTVLGATPGGVVNLTLGIQPGNRFLSRFGVTLGMLDPKIVAQGIVQPDGRAIVQFTIATEELLLQVLLQAFEHAPTPRTTNIVIVSALLLAAGANGSGLTTIAASVLPELLSAARMRWRSTGLSALETQLLNSVSVEMVDLPAGTLGRTVDQRIYVDNTAAGHGWFVDSTPADDEEFDVRINAQARAASAASPASNRMDLLTVLMHELGHVLGYVDVNDAPTGLLMSASLPKGNRRMPVVSDLVSIFAPVDVNQDGVVSPTDALLLINQLNTATIDSVFDLRSAPARYDVNRDGILTPTDALLVINHLNQPARFAGGEGERWRPEAFDANRFSKPPAPNTSFDESLLNVLAADVGQWLDLRRKNRSRS